MNASLTIRQAGQSKKMRNDTRGTSVNIVQAVVLLNQNYLNADGNQFEHLLYLQKFYVTCIHLLISVYIKY
jgi:hypothetical protein